MAVYQRKPKRDSFQDLMTILGIGAQVYGAWNQGQQFQQTRADTAAEGAADRAHDLELQGLRAQAQTDSENRQGLQRYTEQGFSLDPTRAPQHRPAQPRGRMSQFSGDPDADLGVAGGRSTPGYTPDLARFTTEGQARMGMWTKPTEQELLEQRVGYLSGQPTQAGTYLDRSTGKYANIPGYATPLEEEHMRSQIGANEARALRSASGGAGGAEIDQYEYTRAVDAAMGRFMMSDDMMLSSGTSHADATAMARRQATEHVDGLLGRMGEMERVMAISNGLLTSDPLAREQYDASDEMTRGFIDIILRDFAKEEPLDLAGGAGDFNAVMGNLKSGYGASRASAIAEGTPALLELPELERKIAELRRAIGRYAGGDNAEAGALLMQLEAQRAELLSKTSTLGGLEELRPPESPFKQLGRDLPVGPNWF